MKILSVSKWRSAAGCVEYDSERTGIIVPADKKWQAPPRQGGGGSARDMEDAHGLGRVSRRGQGAGQTGPC